MKPTDERSLTPALRPMLRSIGWWGQNGDSTCTVELSLGRLMFEGQAEVNGSPVEPAELAAEATLEALRRLCASEPELGLKTARVLGANGSRVATVVVATATTATDPVTTVGAAIVRSNDTVAVVRATLDALNRMLFDLTGPRRKAFSPA